MCIANSREFARANARRTEDTLFPHLVSRSSVIFSEAGSHVARIRNGGRCNIRVRCARFALLVSFVLLGFLRRGALTHGLLLSSMQRKKNCRETEKYKLVFFFRFSFRFCARFLIFHTPLPRLCATTAYRLDLITREY